MNEKLYFEDVDIPILKISKKIEEKQIKEIKEIKNKRDIKKVNETLNAIKTACSNNENLMPLIINASLEYATLGEIVDSMKDKFGEWKESIFI